jgi:hypothetical protein
MASYSEMLARYQELRRQGYSGPEASQMAFGEGGIAGARQDQARRAARGQRNAGLAQTGGKVVGMGGTIAAYDYLTSPAEAAEKTTQGGAKLAEALGGGSTTAPTGFSSAQEMVQADKFYTPIQGAEVPEGFTAIDVSTQADGSIGQAVVPTESLQEPGFLDSIDFGKVLQGAAGAAQLASAYKAYKSGDYTGAGVMGVGGATNLAASGALGSAAQTGATEALGGYLVPGAQIAAGLYGAKKTADITGSMAEGKQRDIASGVSGAMSGLSLGLGAAGLASLAGGAAGVAGGAAAGAMAGSVVPVVGTIIGAAVGVLASRFMGSGKSKEQVRRDGIRGALQERGVLDENWQGTLADGTKTDFGGDGSILKKSSMDKMREQNPNSYEPTVQLSDALVAAYGFLGDNNRSVGRMYMRGALSNANDDPNIAMANMKHFAAQQGITFDLIKGNLDEGLAQGRIEQPEYERLLTAATTLVPPEGTEPEQVREVRPEAGQVNRLSAGMYRDASGNLVKANSVRAALEKAYNKTKQGRKAEL